MSKLSTAFVPTALCSCVCLALACPTIAYGAPQGDASPQQTPTKDTARRSRPETLETVVVTGTHLLGRTVKASSQPIDIVSGEALRRTGALTLGKALSMALPSLRFPNQSLADLTDFVRPFMLRGMSPDDTLVLVDGQRWHPSAPVFTLGGVAQGAQGYNINSIPVGAIDHVEVLRNGAAAIYGSDAIAGVVNVILKKGAQGGNFTAKVGQYSAGDGRSWQASTNFGVPLSDKGWMRFTLQDGSQDETNRAGPDNRPGFSYLGQKFQLGTIPSKTQQFLMDTQYQITPNVTFYGYGDFSRQIATPFGFFRYGSNTPEPKSPLIANIYPDGFLPIEHGASTDNAIVAGLRGDLHGWHWDTSVNAGGNRLSYHTTNTTNLSLLADFGASPTSFFDGILRAKQQIFNADVTKSFNSVISPNPLNVAFGAQWLRQSYSIEPGELGSYYTSTTHTDAQGGAQGFAGWPPSSAVSGARRNLAEYAQAESKLTDKFDLSVSARHSHYSDFGSNTSYAITGRYAFNREFALRGTASTGFLAPTLGQEFFSQLASADEGPDNNLHLPPGIYLNGVVPSTNSLAALLGGTPLNPQLSHNYTIGAVWTPTSTLYATLDLYQVTVSNTIALSAPLNVASPQVLSYLASRGVANPGFVGLQYFTNAGTQRVRGADLVMSYRALFGDAGSLLSTFSASYHQSVVTHVNPNPAVLNGLGSGFERLTRTQILGYLGDTTPRAKMILDERYDVGNWELGATLTRYGRYTEYSDTPEFDQTFSPKYELDLNASYFLGKWTLTGGINNVFDTYPDQVREDETDHGVLIYDNLSPMSFNGTEYFAQVTYAW